VKGNLEGRDERKKVGGNRVKGKTRAKNGAYIERRASIRKKKIRISDLFLRKNGFPDRHGAKRGGERLRKL